MKPLKEWSVKAPWGNIALMSWGNPKGKPVLLIHGRQDSLSTFIPLLNKLPEKCHYVAFDLPGHGKSDPFPIGIKLMRLHFVSAMDFVVQHLGWKQFVVITHSMGGELAMFYNVVRPNKITKCIHLDIGMALRSITMDLTPDTYKVFYGDYYDNYHKENYDDRIFSKQRAIEAVRNARGLTEPEAELILSRNLIKVGEDQYKLSWDRRLKLVAAYFLSLDYATQLFSRTPPTLYIATELTLSITGKLMEPLKKLKNSKYELVEGGHDVHFTNPERVAGLVNEFLEKDLFVSKL